MKVLASCSGIISSEYLLTEELTTENRQGEKMLYGNAYTGVLASFYANGMIKSKAHYKNGKLDGAYYTYFENGSLMSRRYYQEGEKHGVHRGFFQDGEVWFVYRFRHGMSVGNHQVWYESGQLAQDLNYVDGKPFGTQKVWRPDGKIRSNYVIREDGRRYGLVGIKRCKNIDTEEERVAPLLARNVIQ